MCDLPCALSAACVKALNHFSPCSAAVAGAFTFLHRTDRACTSKIYKSQNKNMLYCLTTGQTSLSQLDCVFTVQQIGPDNSPRAAEEGSYKASQF